MREVQEVPTTGKVDVRPWEVPGAFDKLTKTQQDALGAAYIGQDLWQPRHVLEGLANGGWLQVVRFVCPSWAAHMAWCAWCAEQPDDEEAADAAVRP